MPPETLQTFSLSNIFKTSNCSKINFEFSLCFSPFIFCREFNFEIYLEDTDTRSIRQTSNDTRCDYLFFLLTYNEYHKSFRHSFAQKQKRKMRNFVKFLAEKSKLVAISTNRIWYQQFF